MDLASANDNFIVGREIAVRPRISWGAVFAGAVAALVCLLVLSSLGAAVGLSFTRDHPPTGAMSLIWAIIVAIISLFFGGWTAGQCVAHETRKEAALQGVVLWGVIYFSLVLLSYLGITTSFNIVMGIGGLVTSTWLSPMELAEVARILGLNAEEIMRLEMAFGRIFSDANLMVNAWWALAGVVSSLLASVLGSLIGSRHSLPTDEKFVRREQIIDMQPAQ